MRSKWIGFCFDDEARWDYTQRQRAEKKHMYLNWVSACSRRRHYWNYSISRSCYELKMGKSSGKVRTDASVVVNVHSFLFSASQYRFGFARFSHNMQYMFVQYMLFLGLKFSIWFWYSVAIDNKFSLSQVLCCSAHSTGTNEHWKEHVTFNACAFFLRHSHFTRDNIRLSVFCRLPFWYTMKYQKHKINK